jgi:hypothetical protein
MDYPLEFNKLLLEPDCLKEKRFFKPVRRLYWCDVISYSAGFS